MHPLPVDEAAEVYEHGERLFRQGNNGTRATYSAENAEPTREWLKALPIAPDKRVCVAWDRSMAITLPWNAFVRYWDAFCYPSSDDVFVYPSDKTVALAWNHEEVFQFAGHAV
jgi:hypothetical protein